jgi:hypothetical protein
MKRVRDAVEVLFCKKVASPLLADNGFHTVAPFYVMKQD